MANKSEQTGDSQKKGTQAKTQAAQQQEQQQAKLPNPKAKAECRVLKYNEKGQRIQDVSHENKGTKDGE